MNSENNDDTDKKIDEKLKKELNQRKEELLLMDRFKRVATAKLERMARQSEESGIKYEMGEREKEALAQMHGMGLKEGIAAGIVTFFVLRRGPIYIGRWVQKRRLAQLQQQQQPPPQSGMTPPSGNGYQLSDPRNPFHKARNPEFPRSKNIVLRGIWFAFDCTLSLMMAASVSMAYTDTDKIRQQLIELPLIPGRSLTADALCDAFVTELQKVQQEENPAYKRLMKEYKQKGTNGSMTASYMDGIVNFSEHCQRRLFVERRLQQERHLGKFDKVDIPQPGVARDGPRLIVNGEGEEETVVDDDGFQDLSWASGFVMDQEDHGQR